ncbi:ATP-binding protein [Alteromonas sp. KUL49]|uniref:ATP-binding protein n=1 Tax=Alteromonas sp. KUL49 TaxID=2480798 RepID=UPI0010FFC554|nr:ATP-binding protein [Alteromonas sp. KUL49]GEA10215.1 hypothetical protein KUL49_05900 [Alteromonas sp. KUL49]
MKRTETAIPTALHVAIICLVGVVLNILPAPFDSTGISVFGMGAAIYAALRFRPVIAIPVSLVISLPLWFMDSANIGAESLTFLPIVVSALCFQKSFRVVIRVGVVLWSIIFLPILLFEHAVSDLTTLSSDHTMHLGMMLSGVLVTWVSGLFGLISGQFAYVAFNGLDKASSYSKEQVSLRFLFSYFFSGCFFFAATAVIYLSVHLYQAQQESQINYYMQQRIDVLEQQLSEFLKVHQKAISLSANTLSTTPSERFSTVTPAQLESLSVHYPEFLTYLVTDDAGEITYAYPPDVLEKARASGFANVAHRPYFSEPMRTGSYFISNVFQGTGFGNDPIVALSAPILNNNDEPVGIVEGSLSLKSFEVIDQLSLSGFSLLIEDQKGDVIYASSPLRLPPLSKSPSYDCDPNCDAKIENGMQGKTWLRFVGELPDVGWRVSYHFDYRGLMVAMSNYLLKDLILLILLSGLGSFAGFMVARLFNQPIQNLIQYIGAFNPKIEFNQKRPSLPSLSIRELAQLNDEFTRHERRLVDAFEDLEFARIKEQELNRELASLNTSLEGRIKEKTQHLAEALDEAKAAGVAKSQFLANMSHEIRTPMNGIIGSCELALEDDLPAGTRKRIEVISRSAANLLLILDSVLDWSKIEAGKVLVDNQPTNLRHLLEASLALYEHLAKQKSIFLTLQVDDALPLFLNTDSGKISQIVNNLVSNAIKFTQQGGVAVKARYRKQHLTITVSDTGIGIPKHKQETIFEQFEQADASTTRNFGGTGLGLAISKGLIERLEGTVTLSSRDGEGTRFVVSIPCEEVADHSTSTSQGKASLPSSLFVLLAEDNDINAEIVVSMLDKQGIRADRAVNGAEAVAMAEQQAYDVILMDCQMPVMDGLLAAREIRLASKENQQTPIIALTANAFAEDKQACYDAGMNAHLSKPIRKDVLFECIAEQMSQH